MTILVVVGSRMINLSLECVAFSVYRSEKHFQYTDLRSNVVLHLFADQYPLWASYRVFDPVCWRCRVQSQAWRKLPVSLSFDTKSTLSYMLYACVNGQVMRETLCRSRDSIVLILRLFRMKVRAIFRVMNRALICVCVWYVESMHLGVNVTCFWCVQAVEKSKGRKKGIFFK